MEYIVSGSEMYKYDHYTSEVIGVPELVLMERAALAVYSDMPGRFEIDKSGDGILILCGTGNNGGDGLALSRLLYLGGYNVRALLIGNLSKASKSNQIQKNILDYYSKEKQIYEHYEVEEAATKIKEILIDFKPGLIIDSVFGIGLNRNISGEYERIFKSVNEYEATRIALDIPSGINADGLVLGVNVYNASLTYTFGFTKLGSVLYPSAGYCGETVKLDVGIDEKSFGENPPLCIRKQNMEDFEWPIRRNDANKGTYKKLLIIAGNEEIIGALILATGAALACGIGMVMVLTHENNRMLIADKYPEVLIKTYCDTDDEEKIITLFTDAQNWADGILIGPGLGQGVFGQLLTGLAINSSGKPVCFDADSINIISKNTKYQEDISTYIVGRKMIFTPHLMEMSRISGYSIEDIRKNRIEICQKLADRFKATIVCKDAITVISSYEDLHVYINSSGCEGMASAGTGDVLAGICAVLMLQMDDSLEAASAAAFVHGKAGCLASDLKGSRAMMASDIINELKRLWK